MHRIVLSGTLPEPNIRLRQSAGYRIVGSGQILKPDSTIRPDNCRISGNIRPDSGIPGYRIDRIVEILKMPDTGYTG